MALDFSHNVLRLRIIGEKPFLMKTDYFDLP